MAKKKNELEDTRSDEELLIDVPTVISTSVGDFEIKPWTFGSYRKVAAIIDAMLESLNRRNINFELLFNRFGLMNYLIFVHSPMEKGETPDPDIAERFSEEFNVEYRTLMRLIASISDFAYDIILNTIDITEEELDELDADEGMSLFLTIIAKNEGVLKNVYGLFEMQHSTEVTPEESKQEGKRKKKTG